MRRTVLAVVCLIAVGAWAAAGYAATVTNVWDFNPNGVNAAVGSNTFTEQGSVNGLPPLGLITSQQVTVSGWDANNRAHDLFWKVAGADEHGIGLTGTNDFELTLNPDGNSIANYIMIDVSQEVAAHDSNMYIRVQSVQLNSPGDQEAYDVWGSNAPNVFGTKLMSGYTNSNTFVPVPLDGPSYYNYYFVTETPGSGLTHASDNILPDAISFDVPEPATMSLLAIGALAIFRRRRGRMAD